MVWLLVDYYCTIFYYHSTRLFYHDIQCLWTTLVLENPRFCAEAQLSQHRGVADPLHSFRWSREIFYACCTFGTSIPGPCPGSSQPYSSSITAHGMLYSATWKECVGTEFMGFETLMFHGGAARSILRMLSPTKVAWLTLQGYIPGTPAAPDHSFYMFLLKCLIKLIILFPPCLLRMNSHLDTCNCTSFC